MALTSVFIRPLEAEFGWSRADISLAYTLSSVGMAVGGLLWGRLSDRLSIKNLLFIGSVGMVIALAALSFANSLWQIYVTNLALGGLGFSCLYAPVLAVTGLWFDRRRGLAIGIVTAGGALGQGIMPYVANALIDAVGWRLAYAIMAVATTAMLAISMPSVQVPPVDRVVAAPLYSSARPGFQGGRLHPVALLSAAAFLCYVCMGVPLMHLTSFVTAVCGSSDVGSLSLLIAMLFGALGRIAFGLLADRAGNLCAYAAASFIQTACVAIFPALDQQLSLLVLSAVFGFGFAGNMTCLILCVRQFAAAERFAQSIGVVMLVAWVGMGAAGGRLSRRLRLRRLRQLWTRFPGSMCRRRGQSSGFGRIGSVIRRESAGTMRPPSGPCEEPLIQTAKPTEFHVGSNAANHGLPANLRDR